MSKPLIFVTIPGFRAQDFESMPQTQQRLPGWQSAPLEHSFPAVTWPSQANMLTGTTVAEHGIPANGIFWRDRQHVEMWTAWNEVIERPQIWDVLKTREVKTAAWFPMLSKGCNADFVCMPAPIHKPDGSEEMWCHTKPQEFYGELLDKFEHFPLHHFWGPLANIKSSEWIVNSAIAAWEKFQPDFGYIYIPHLDYQAQKFGPNSEQARQSVQELDHLLARFIDQINTMQPETCWLLVSEYVIQDVDHVIYPNRILRENELLQVQIKEGLEYLDFTESPAWALVDHQLAHIFVKDHEPSVISRIVELFSDFPGVERILDKNAMQAEGLAHNRCGDLILVSASNSWQAYYWWEDDSKAPEFARNVDIHQKPGYDPVEMFMDMSTRQVPLDASQIRGSHGIPCPGGVLVASQTANTLQESYLDTEVYNYVLSHYE